MRLLPRTDDLHNQPRFPGGHRHHSAHLVQAVRLRHQVVAEATSGSELGLCQDLGLVQQIEQHLLDDVVDPITTLACKTSICPALSRTAPAL
jgi:hypothetical protein